MRREKLKDKFKRIHSEDIEHLGFIISEEKKIIVTAPAGCGKTKAMISKIAHEIITNKYLNQKKILALTFSVNAAAKIREDTKETLPILLEDENYNVDNMLDVFNYHSFASCLLKKHGHVLHKNLNNIHDFIKISDDSEELKAILDREEINILKDYDISIKNINIDEIQRLQVPYSDIILKRLVPLNFITYNGLLLIATKLLDIEAINKFYKVYYQMVIIDEFQDTNYLALQFLKKIIDDNKVILIGDDIQKIYGFLGAVPNLFSRMQSDYNMVPMEFKTNYRFKDNEDMRGLENYLRCIIKNYKGMDNFAENSNVKFKLFKSDNEEANFIYKDLLKRVECNKNVAILFRAKYLSNDIIEIMEKNKQSYFNGIFDDSNNDYIMFHKRALDIFVKESVAGRSIRKTVRKSVIDNMKAIRESITSDEVMFNSLIRLLEALLESIALKKISIEDKYERITFTLNSNSLKRLLTEIDEKVILTTIHGSKGLEWDYVYLPKMTAHGFPTSRGLCKSCANMRGGSQYEEFCKFNFIAQLEDSFIEELRVLYVGVTRAKIDVFLTANNGKNIFNYSKKRGCFVSLPNMNIVDTF